MRSDNQERLDRSLRAMLGENSLLIKTHTFDEVKDMLISARTKSVSSIEFDGNLEPVCESKLRDAKFNFHTFKNTKGIIITRISW